MVWRQYIYTSLFFFFLYKPIWIGRMKYEYNSAPWCTAVYFINALKKIARCSCGASISDVPVPGVQSVTARLWLMARIYSRLVSNVGHINSELTGCSGHVIWGGGTRVTAMHYWQDFENTNKSISSTSWFNNSIEHFVWTQAKCWVAAVIRNPHFQSCKQVSERILSSSGCRFVPIYQSTGRYIPEVRFRANVVGALNITKCREVFGNLIMWSKITRLLRNKRSSCPIRSTRKQPILRWFTTGSGGLVFIGFHLNRSQ